jgi:hypothetical protein
MSDEKEVRLIITPDEASRLRDRNLIRDKRSWMVDKIMGTGQVHILAGPSGSGKTSWILPFIKEWSEGKLIFNRYQSFSQPYIYLSCDRSMNELDQTLTRLGLRDWDIPCFSIEELETKWGLDHNRVIVEDLPRIFPWCKVFFIEAIGWFAPSGSKNHNYTDILRYWSRIRATYEERGLTIVGTTHAPKSKADMKYANARDRIIGSVAQAGVASTIMVFDLEDEGDVRNSGRLITLLPRNEPNQIFRYALDNNGKFVYKDEVEEAPLESAKAYNLIERELIGMPVDCLITEDTRKGWADRTGLSRKTMTRVQNQMCEEKILVRVNKERGIYQLKKLVKNIVQ